MIYLVFIGIMSRIKEHVHEVGNTSLREDFEETLTLIWVRASTTGPAGRSREKSPIFQDQLQEEKTTVQHNISRGLPKCDQIAVRSR